MSFLKDDEDEGSIRNDSNASNPTSMAASKSFVRSFPSTTQHQIREKADVTTPILIPHPDHGPLVVTCLQTPTARLNIGQQGNAFAQHQVRERPDATMPLVVTSLQTPTTLPNVVKQENAFAQQQVGEKSDATTPLVVTGLQTPTA